MRQARCRQCSCSPSGSSGHSRCGEPDRDSEARSDDTHPSGSFRRWSIPMDLGQQPDRAGSAAILSILGFPADTSLTFRFSQTKFPHSQLRTGLFTRTARQFRPPKEVEGRLMWKLRPQRAQGDKNQPSPKMPVPTVPSADPARARSDLEHPPWQVCPCPGTCVVSAMGY